MIKISPQEINVLFENILEDKEKILWVSELNQDPNSTEHSKDIFVSYNIERLTGVTREAMLQNCWKNFLGRLANIDPTNTFMHVSKKIINRTTAEPSTVYCLEGTKQEKIFIKDTILCSLQHKHTEKTFNAGIIKIISAQEYEKFSPAINSEIPEPIFTSIFGNREELNIIKPSEKNAKPFLAMENNKIITITPRESQCFRYLLEGMSSKSIARQLNISPRTVEIHFSNIKNKTGTTRRIELLSKIKNIGNF